MSREELIQQPEYWNESYNNECWRLGIPSNKVIFANKEYIQKLIADVVDYCQRFGITPITAAQCYEHLYASTNEK